MKKSRNILFLFLFLLAVYFVLRFAFYAVYYSGQIKTIELPFVFYWGGRMDLSSLIYLHAPFLLYYFFVHDLMPAKMRNITAVGLLLLLNLPFLALNIIDLAYFRFTLTRSTSDLLTVWSDSLTAAGAFLKAYWRYVVLFVGCGLVTGWFVYRLFGRERETPWRLGPMIRRNIFPFLLVVIPAGILARGWSATPIMPYTPLLYFSPEYQALVTNSTVTFLYSMVRRQGQLQERSYPELRSDDRYSLRKQFEQNEPFCKKNVVIFILESFCKEYLEEGNSYRCETPFLDSIIARSTWYSDAYANGLTSNHGIMSILGSLPSFTDEPYYYSVYSHNRIRGIGTLLKEKGYSTHFFMGAGPDHFGFGKACNILGIDQYHSGADFGDDRFQDGNWGIYDHKFLPFAAQELNRQQGPFLSVIFNLSSHFPFKIPPGFAKRFQEAGSPAFKKSTAYVDYSLQLFFDEIRDSSWYRNTIFYFIADHSIVNAIEPHTRTTSMFSIPFFVFDPSSPVGRSVPGTVQQLDLVPTILDGLHYGGPFLSFGRSLHRKGEGFMISRWFYDADTYLYRSDSLELAYNGRLEKPVYLHDLRNGRKMENVVHDSRYASRLRRLVTGCRSFLQRYSEAVLNDDLYIK